MEVYRENLLRVLREVRGLLARPENNFDWSSWRDAAHALGELDGHIKEIEAGEGASAMLSVLFAPTGPIQEVSLSSGWGDEFVAAADAFDIAFAAFPKR